jgi:hypothetical protein
LAGIFGANEPGGMIQVGKNTTVTDGNYLIGDFVNVGSGSNIFRVLANHLHAGFGAIIKSTGTPTLPIHDPFCPIPAIDCTGGTNEFVTRGANVALLPGVKYGVVAAQNAANITFAGPGTFTLCELRTARLTTVVVTGAGQSTINIAGNFRVANQGSFLPAPNVPTPIVNVGGLSVRIGANAQIQAILSAPNAALSVGRSGRLSGAFCFDTTRSDKQVHLTCPSSPSGAFVE